MRHIYVFSSLLHHHHQRVVFVVVRLPFEFNLSALKSAETIKSHHANVRHSNNHSNNNIVRVFNNKKHRGKTNQQKIMKCALCFAHVHAHTHHIVMISHDDDHDADDAYVKQSKNRKEEAKERINVNNHRS